MGRKTKITLVSFALNLMKIEYSSYNYLKTHIIFKDVPFFCHTENYCLGQTLEFSSLELYMSVIRNEPSN